MIIALRRFNDARNVFDAIVRHDFAKWLRPNGAFANEFVAVEM